MTGFLVSRRRSGSGTALAPSHRLLRRYISRVVDAHRYHEISETTHRIMNPLSHDRLMLAGAICRLGPGARVLDLACGKGEMLCQFARAFGIRGIGVDVSEPVLALASKRARELGVADDLEFRQSDAALAMDLGSFEMVSCIGATWIGGDLAGTLEIMKSYAVSAATLLVGEVYWKKPPSSELAAYYGQEFADLGGTLDIFTRSGVDLVEMVLTNDDDWDRYAASQWLNVADWLLANPNDPDATSVREHRDESRRLYLESGRDTVGWGIFIGRLEQ